MPLRTLRTILVSLVVLGAAVALPAAAHAAPPTLNPSVLRLDGNGAETVLGGGAPFTTLGGIALGQSGALYVANQGPVGPNPAGAGIYSLADPSSVTKTTAFTPIATKAPTGYPAGIVAAGSTLFSLDGDQVIRIDQAAPHTQTVLTSGGLFDRYGVNPTWGAVAGSTLYTTGSGDCDSAEGGGAYVIGVDTATGAQSITKSLGCIAISGIAAEPAGTLLIAERAAPGGSKIPARIVRLNPATGSVTTVSSGKNLKTPQGLAYDTDNASVYVADATTGVIQITAATGNQYLLAASGTPGEDDQLAGANGIAIDAADRIYISEAGVPPAITASARSTQRFSTRGIAFTAACNRTCTVGYVANVAIKRGTGFSQDAAFTGVGKKKTLVVKLPGSVNTRIARALRRKQAVTVSLTVTPQDPRTGNPGVAKRLKVRLVK